MDLPGVKKRPIVANLGIYYNYRKLVYNFFLNVKQLWPQRKKLVAIDNVWLFGYIAIYELTSRGYRHGKPRATESPG